MERLTHQKIQKLAKHNDRPSVSMYVSLEGDYYDIRERLLQLTKQARKQLENVEGLSYQESRDFVAPIYQQIHNRQVWWHESHHQNAAIFLDDKANVKVFALPDSEDNHVVVGRGFEVTKLFGQLVEHGRFYALTLTNRRATLIRSDVSGIETVMIANNDRLRTAEKDGQRDYFSKSHDRSDYSYRKFASSVSDQIRKQIDDRTSPLIVVGLPKVQSVFRSAASYELMLEDGVQVNPDSLSTSEIVDRAQPMAQRFYRYYEHEAQEELAAKEASKEQIVSGVRGVIEAIRSGQVRTLFIDSERTIWGAPVSHAVHRNRKQGDVNITDLILREALRLGVEVFRLPGKERNTQPMAITRY